MVTDNAFKRVMQPHKACSLPDKKLCCVLTYALIPGGWSKIFIKHYKSLIDGQIYIMCPDDLSSYPEFQDESVCLLPLPRHEFQNQLVTDLFEKFSSILLYFHKAVIIPDLDELFLPLLSDGPDEKPTRSDFPSAIKRLISSPIALRALGLNVLQLPEEDTYDSEKSLFSQRKLIHPISPMNKIAVLFEPCRLTKGKHFTTAPCLAPLMGNEGQTPSPGFSVLNFHMHHACQEISGKSRKSLQLRPISSERTEYYQTKRKTEYPFLNNRLRNGKVSCSILDIDSNEMNDWIHQWNDRLMSAEADSNGFWTTEQCRASFLVRIPDIL